MSGLPSGGAVIPASTLVGIVTDASGAVTGMKQADGTVIPILAPAPTTAQLQPILGSAAFKSTSDFAATAVLNSAVASVVHGANGHTTITTIGGASSDAGIANRRGNSSYTTAAAASGTVTMPVGGNQYLWLTGASSVSSLTITLPTDTVDGDKVTIASPVPVSSLTIKDGSGNTVLSGAPFPALSELRVLNASGTWQVTQQPAAVQASAVMSTSGAPLKILQASGTTDANGLFTISISSAAFKTAPQVYPASVVSGATVTTATTVAITSVSAISVTGVVSRPAVAVTLLSTALVGAPVAANGVTVNLLAIGT